MDEQTLTDEYTVFLTTHSFDDMSAEELMYELHASGNHTHDAWLNDFINRWERIVYGK